MKKFMVLCLGLMIMATAAMAENASPIQVVQMPSKAQRFIKKYYDDTQVAYARMESGMLNSYEVGARKRRSDRIQ